MPMQATGVVVADRNRASISTVPRGMARLRQLAELRHSGTSMRRDGGRPGVGEARISDQACSCGERQAHSFAAQLARHVEDARSSGCFDELVLVAAPPFLADLRDRLSQAARDAVIGEIEKNLVAAQRETLQEQVLRVL